MVACALAAGPIAAHAVCVSGAQARTLYTRLDDHTLVLRGSTEPGIEDRQVVGRPLGSMKSNRSVRDLYPSPG
jgi:hypothetical protein